MRFLCWILLFTLALPSLKAQKPYDKDSLLNVFEDQTQSDYERMRAANFLVDKFYRNRTPDSAKYYGFQILELANRSNHIFYQAIANQTIGDAIIESGKPQDAMDYYRKGISLLGQLEKQRTLANMYNAVGLTWYDMGEFDSALYAFDQGLALQPAIEDSGVMVTILYNMGVVYDEIGEIPKAIEVTEKGLELNQRHGRVIDRLNGTANLGAYYSNIGDLVRANEQYLKALPHFISRNLIIGTVGTYINLADIQKKQNNYPAAQAYLEKGIHIADSAKHYPLLLAVYQVRADLYRKLGQEEEALAVFEGCLELAEKEEILFDIPKFRLEIGETLLELGRVEESAPFLREALVHFQQYQHIEELRRCYLQLSIYSRKIGNWQQAREYAQQSLTVVQESGSPSKIISGAKELATIEKKLGNNAEVVRLYELLMLNSDSLYNEKSTRELINQQYQYTYQQKALQDSLESASVIAVKEQENLRRKTVSNFLLAGLALALIFGLLLFSRFRIARKQKAIIEEEKIKLDKANAKLKELDGFKSRFFTNISHEFRTPLTVIKGMNQQILQQPETWLEKGTELIDRNTRSLLHLINQILDLRKLESGNLTLKPIQMDVIQALRLSTASFESLAESKDIDLEFKTDEEKLFMDIDPEKLGQITNNLLSNALKFTSEGGQVLLHSFRTSDSNLSIIVKDSGRGIPAEKLPYIFDRFYQVDGTDTRVGEGTGVGLSLTQELVNLMGGKITVESEEGQGSTFTLNLPIQQQLAVKHIENTLKAEVQFLSAPLPLPTQPETDLPRLLIIEDNPDIVSYLYSLLEGQYILSSAPDGQTGIDLAFENIPDLIITDVMMPNKNGYEVSETLKLDERTSHIPIVMLTAKADQESRLEGYKRGADAYLGKPFDQAELKIRLQKLWEIRQRLQARYRRGLPLAQTADPTEKQEDLFISKARSMVKARIDDPAYNREVLCKDLGLSKSTLNRKLKALTGKSIGHFIRMVRMDHAKELLTTQTDLQISEVAYATGFNDRAYFSRVFTAENGLPPLEWKEKQLNGES